MIFIKTHTDFNFLKLPIHKEKYNNFSIICRDKLNDSYPVNVIYDNDNFLNKWSYLYGDLTYHYYVYKHFDLYDDIIGFLQYRRWFTENTINNYKEILKNKDVILPNKFTLNIVKQYDQCHVKGLLSDIIELIYKYKPSYRKIDLANINFIIPHNMFIMHKKDYIEYCKFMFWCFEIFNVKYKTYDKINVKEYYRIFSFLAERVSTFFYINYFNNILYDYVIYDPLQK